MQINEEKYAYLRDGIPVTEKKPNGQTEEKRAMIIDFIVDELKKKKKHVDNTDLMVQINGILGDYIMIERTPYDRGLE